MNQPPHVRRRSRRRLARLRALGYASYRAYLISPHWRSVRALYWASDLPQQCICGETEALQLHHLTYDRIGGEALTDLVPLCATCHADIHVLERRGEIGLDFAGLYSRQRATHYAEHALHHERPDGVESLNADWQPCRNGFDIALIAWIVALADGAKIPPGVNLDIAAINRRLDSMYSRLSARVA